jgi:hypothetical protein
LPSGPDGKPCYLSADDQGGYVSRLADHIEAYQLGMASQLLEHAGRVLDDETEDLEELNLLAAQLTSALRDVLRAATRFCLFGQRRVQMRMPARWSAAW